MIKGYISNVYPDNIDFFNNKKIKGHHFRGSHWHIPKGLEKHYFRLLFLFQIIKVDFKAHFFDAKNQENTLSIVLKIYHRMSDKVFIYKISLKVRIKAIFNDV